MTVREEVIELIDELSEEDLRAVERYARYLRSGTSSDLLTWILDNAPEEDEVISAEEEQAVEEARQDIRDGRLVSAEEAKQLLLQ